tara:strand:- start:312 stop:602 length:291 start_codon:yes stop_codon:yes gene_type:complete
MKNKKKLIALVEESGIHCNIVSPHRQKDIYYFLWMCEVQKSLREAGEYDTVIVQVIEKDFEYFAQYRESNKEFRYTTIFESYEDALEDGLIEALEI